MRHYYARMVLWWKLRQKPSVSAYVREDFAYLLTLVSRIHVRILLHEPQVRYDALCGTNSAYRLISWWVVDW